MSAIEQIMERLKRHPELTHRLSGPMITIDSPAANGFDVSLWEGKNGWIVHFDAWHEHFQSEDEALNCFVFGLSDRCRLRTDYRGAFAHLWTLEVRIIAGWREDSATGLAFFPFWRRPRVGYRQNDVITDD